MDVQSSPGYAVRVARLVVSAVVVALLIAVTAAALSGSAAPPVPGVPDAGGVVRWGLIVARVLHDLMAALTVGGLLVAATIVPEAVDHRALRHGRPTGAAPRRATLLVIMSATSFCWALAGLAGVLLGFADIAGLPLTHPAYLPDLFANAMTIEPLRNGIFTTSAALVIASLAAMVRSRAWTVALAVMAGFALIPLAFAGHSASAVSHETAVNMLGVHLVAACVWVGGLLAIVLVRPLLGRDLISVLERFSRLAVWAYVALIVSGLILGLAQLDSLADLSSPYGLEMVAKLVAAIGLGALGYSQRRISLTHLRAQVTSVRAFTRLAVSEIALMAVATGLAVSLSRTAPPAESVLPDKSTIWALTGFSDPGAPDAWSWITAWRVDWLWLGVSLVAIGLYAAGVVRLHRRGDRWPVSRPINWTIGWLLFLWATNSGPMIYGRVSFSWHMTFHMLLVMVIPIFLALGAPVTLAARSLSPRRDGTMGPRELILGYVHSPYAAFWGHPIVASMNFFGSMIAFYYSPLFDMALRSHGGHVAMIVHFTMTGYVFAWMLMGVDPGPRRWAPPLRVVTLFATISFHAFFGVAIASGTTLLAADFFQSLRIPWIRDLLADQQAGGNITWAIGEAPTLALALLVTLSWVRTDRAETTRRDRQADRDGEAELTAYNARLQAIADQDQRREQQRG